MADLKPRSGMRVSVSSAAEMVAYYGEIRATRDTTGIQGAIEHLMGFRDSLLRLVSAIAHPVRTYEEFTTVREPLTSHGDAIHNFRMRLAYNVASPYGRGGILGDVAGGKGLGRVLSVAGASATAFRTGLAAERTVITKGSQVTEQTIRAAMKDAPLQSQQAGGVSLPKVQQYVDKILAGETAPAIKVDAGMIVDGNHRYIAGRILGQEPAVQPWIGGRPDRAVPWNQIPIDPASW